MEIDDRRTSAVTESIKVGDVFLDDEGDYMMRVAYGDKEWDLALTDGSLYTLGSANPVTLLPRCRLVVED